MPDNNKVMLNSHPDFEELIALIFVGGEPVAEVSQEIKGKKILKFLSHDPVDAVIMDQLLAQAIKRLDEPKRGQKMGSE